MSPQGTDAGNVVRLADWRAGDSPAPVPAASAETDAVIARLAALLGIPGVGPDAAAPVAAPPANHTAPQRRAALALVR